MTPQLQQAIKLLQFSNLELTSYVEQQLEQNPLLERDETADSGGGASASEADEHGSPGENGDGFASVDRALSDDYAFTSGNAMDVDYDNQFDGEVSVAAETAVRSTDMGLQSSWGERSGRLEDSVASLENTLSSGISLREHLTEQLAIDIDDPVDRIIGLHLIETLDDTGYMTANLAQLAESLGCAEVRITETLSRLQQFDPAGIFARDLSECLALQLRDRGRLDDAIQTLLDHLDLLAKGEVGTLSKVCDVETEDLLHMIAELRSLNPKPALAFDNFVAQPITPDVIMKAHPGGGWIVELNSESLPKVLINSQYYSRIYSSQMKKKERHYLNECFQAANWLIRSLHQRATTILRVATEIVRQQDEFFLKGVSWLRPLVLRDISQAVDLHESTVSRVTSNKYISTPRGIFELKYFFSQPVGGSEGGVMHSAEAVRHRIKLLIDNETAENVLSDDTIADMLQKEGIEIARRTVAKYREAMGLPSSVRRRQRMARM